jgi:hypothetical protein
MKGTYSLRIRNILNLPSLSQSAVLSSQHDRHNEEDCLLAHLPSPCDPSKVEQSFLMSKWQLSEEQLFNSITHIYFDINIIVII